MSVEPAESVVTSPVEAFTVATDVLLLLQDPVPPPNTTPLAVKMVGEPPIQSGLVPLTEVTAAVGITENEYVEEQAPTVTVT